MFDELANLTKASPATTVDALIERLRESEDYHALFYALLMKARVALGVSPFPTGPASDLPGEVHAAYEEVIRTAAREVGGLYLAKNDLPRAWTYFRLIHEPQPVKDALDRYEPGPDDDVYPILDIAWHQRVHPARGFDLMLDRLGICSSITTVSSTDFGNDVALRMDCVRKLIAALHAQLLERLSEDPASRVGPLPEDGYHIDVSHLSSVVTLALELPPGDAALAKARELCAYGERLSPGLRGRPDAPFEDSYSDYGVYLAVLAGENVDAGLQHFESKIEPELRDGNTFPAEVFINLLVRLDRLPAALAAARTYLSDLPVDITLSCPGVMELAMRTKDYAALADTARAKGDAVTFVASLIANAKPVS